MKVEYIDHMGCDLTPVNAARVSFDQESYLECPKHGTDWDTHCDDCWSSSSLSARDKKLVGYLSKHDHWTPFAHYFMSFRITAPIFVARQLAKHQVGLAWNEVSRRYVSSEPEIYCPDLWRYKPSGNIKQGSSEHGTDSWSGEYEIVMNRLIELYNDLIGDGICPEQARMVLPQSMMTSWYWSGSVYAFARVCKLRLDSHAQRETQEIASQIDVIASELFPNTWRELVPLND